MCFALQHYSGYVTNEVETEQILSKASNDRVLSETRERTRPTLIKIHVLCASMWILILSNVR